MNPAPDGIAGVDLGALVAWMDRQRLGTGPLTDLRPLTGGTQNILLQFIRDDRTYVLRRPPVSKRGNSDETMRREARVLGALRDSDVPHPALIALCADVDVLGAAFYLMEPVDGFSPLAGLPKPLTSDPVLQRRLGESMIDALAALGRIDYRERGLESLGRAENWQTRQVQRWRSQLDSYRDVLNYPGHRLPHVDRIADWLTRNTPVRSQPGLMHGDFHFGNVLVRHDEPRIAAIVDWELSTIGDPLLDLGHLLANWPDLTLPGRAGVPDAPGMPTAAEAVERYAQQSGRDVSDFMWFAVLACYRLGILLEGSNARAYAGSTTREIGDRLGARARQLFEQADALLDSAALP